MNNFAAAGHSSKLIVALTALLVSAIVFGYWHTDSEESDGERKHTMVVLADDLFKVPRNYLSTDKTFPGKIELDYMIVIHFFFPDFAGLGEGDNLSVFGPYNKKQVTASWTRVSGGGHLDANRRLNNALKYGISKRAANLDVDGMTTYKNVNNGGVTYLTKNTQGDNVLIHCDDGPGINICKLECLDSNSNRGIIATFDKEYLPRWPEINNKILSFMAEWQVLEAAKSPL